MHKVREGSYKRGGGSRQGAGVDLSPTCCSWRAVRAGFRMISYSTMNWNVLRIAIAVTGREP